MGEPIDFEIYIEWIIFEFGVPNVEVTGPKLTAGFDSRGGLRSEATTGARRTKLAVNLWSGAETR